MTVSLPPDCEPLPPRQTHLQLLCQPKGGTQEISEKPVNEVGIKNAEMGQGAEEELEPIIPLSFARSPCREVPTACWMAR